MTLDLMLSEG
jgi:hypothetical protein